MTIKTKFAVFGALWKYTSAYHFRFLERGAVVSPGTLHSVVWWTENGNFHGELYTPDAQFVAKIEVPL